MNRKLLPSIVLTALLSACGAKKSEEPAAADDAAAAAAEPMERAPDPVVRSKDGLIVVPPVNKPHDAIPDPSPKSDDLEPRRYIFWWSGEMCFDGFYNFVVHPGQVFVRTENFEYNKQADIVIWQREISDEQYRAIQAYVDGGTSKVFLPETLRKHPGYALYRLNDLERRAQIPPGNYSGSLAPVCNPLAVRNIEDVLRELDSIMPLDAALLSSPVVLGGYPVKILKE